MVQEEDKTKVKKKEEKSIADPRLNMNTNFVKPIKLQKPLKVSYGRGKREDPPQIQEQEDLRMPKR